MASRLYSFRYPFDLAQALDPWRDRFSQREFEQVVALLTERDRALEDHLNLGIGQGYLGVGTVPNGGQALTAAYADVSGATVTFNAPAGRKLRVTVYCGIINLDAAARSSFVRVLDENNTVLVGTSRDHGASGSKDQAKEYREIVFVAPTGGAHTYRLQALINGGSGTLTSNVPANNSGGSSFLSVEDVGPAT